MIKHLTMKALREGIARAVVESFVRLKLLQELIED